jgi:hypothetical protein
LGAARRRITNTVDFPMKPALVTRTSSRVPALSARSKGRSRPVDAGDVYRREGQSLPRHVTMTREPRGARTLSSVTRAPPAVSTPLIRTTGNGRRSLGGGADVATGAANTAGTGDADAVTTVVCVGAVGVAVSVGVAVGVGDGVGVGVGDAVGTAVGVGVGAGATMAVGPERFSSEPSPFVTRRRTRSTAVASDCVIRYDVLVAPAMTSHEPVGSRQRSHAQAGVGAGVPCQVAVAVSSAPT